MHRSLSPWLLLAALALAGACSGSGDGASGADVAAEAADTVIPADVPADLPADGVGKDAADVPADLPAEGADKDAIDAADAPPAVTWTLDTEAAEPTTDAWVRVTAGAFDPAAGALTVSLEASAFPSLLGLSFHLGVEPELASVAAVTRVYEPTQAGSTKWGLLARAGAADVQGALAIMRAGESGFGGGGQALSGALPAPTVLYQVQLALKKPGTLHVSLDFADTVAVAPDWTALPLERVGLTVTSTQEVAE